MPAKSSKSKSGPVVLVGTRKGAFLLEGNAERNQWKVSEPIFLGHIIYHFVACPRDPKVMIMGAKTGHLGPTVFLSTDAGKTFSEAKRPPAFPPVEEGKNGKAVESVFWISPGHESEPGVFYAGTAPPGLFRSEDCGNTWEPVAGFHDHPSYKDWTEGGATPGGQLLHSILIDPRDRNHMYFGISVGGVFETKSGGKDWAPLNKGVAADFLPDPTVPFGHDPHLMVMSALKPDRLFHQNHCGIYRIDRPGDTWTRIGNNMPREVGDIGFPIVQHPRDPNCLWVFPMDGTEVWPRTSPGGKPATYITRDGGDSWERQDRGLPQKDAYFTVKRQAMASDTRTPAGIYFGTTGGEVWGSTDEGENYACLVRYLPEIYSLAVWERP